MPVQGDAYALPWSLVAGTPQRISFYPADGKRERVNVSSDIDSQRQASKIALRLGWYLAFEPAPQPDSLTIVLAPAADD